MNKIKGKTLKDLFSCKDQHDGKCRFNRIIKKTPEIQISNKKQILESESVSMLTNNNGEHN